MSETSSPSPSVGETTSDGATTSPRGIDSREATKDLEGRIVRAVRTVYDPEIPIDIYELGLIYSVDVGPEGDVTVLMTLTAPGCPVAFSLPRQVEAKVREVEGVRSCRVEVVWDPPWNPSMMSEAARLQLGFNL